MQVDCMRTADVPRAQIVVLDEIVCVIVQHRTDRVLFFVRQAIVQ